MKKKCKNRWKIIKENENSVFSFYNKLIMGKLWVGGNDIEI